MKCGLGLQHSQLPEQHGNCIIHQTFDEEEMPLSNGQFYVISFYKNDYI